MAFEELRKVRLEKLENLKKAGIDPFPAKVEFPVADISVLKKDFKKQLKNKKGAAIAGRITAKREHGNAIFADLSGGSNKLQIFIGRDQIGSDSFRIFSENIDIGDFIAVFGKAFYTKRKEPTIEVKNWQLLAKALRPLPEKWHGLQDIEERFRKRYLDLLMNEEVRNRFVLRSQIVTGIRSILDKEGFLEVETPVLQDIAGGATAKPFKTHHNALNTDLFLRIAPELFLKRLLIGGYNKIYEIGKVFRNEGIDKTHNPEYTMLEFYAAYWDETEMMNFIEKMMFGLAKKINVKTFKKNFPRISFLEVLQRYAQIIDYEKESEVSLQTRAKQLGIEVPEKASKAKLAEEIFEKIARPKLINPTFVTDFPLELSPLSKGGKKSNLVRRFNLIIGGSEIADGWSEINNPEEQVNRFQMQEKAKQAGEEETHPYDEDFVQALEYGMPPAAGVGFGIDRLTMLLTDTHNIKEVILFPTMKPKEQ